VQEFLNVATRKFKKPLSLADAQQYLTRVLEPLCEIYSSVGLYHQALEIASRWKYAFYDSLMIAAALNSSCQVLYSEDLQDEQRLMELVIANPFRD
jgi:predicted nucleic acid-binding protein